VGLKEIFTKNIGWKIGGLALALALWFHLATEKVYEKNFAVDIEAVGLAENLAIGKIVPPTADITVTGTGKQLLKLSFLEQLTLKADLSGIKTPGVYRHKFNIVDIYPIDVSMYQRISLSGNGDVEIFIVDKI
jgi:hypothetical protein